RWAHTLASARLISALTAFSASGRLIVTMRTTPFSSISTSGANGLSVMAVLRVGTKRSRLCADVRAEDLGVVELVGLPGERHLALVEQEHEVGDLQRPGDVLLDEEQR